MAAASGGMYEETDLEELCGDAAVDVFEPAVGSSSVNAHVQRHSRVTSCEEVSNILFAMEAEGVLDRFKQFSPACTQLLHDFHPQLCGPANHGGVVPAGFNTNRWASSKACSHAACHGIKHLAIPQRLAPAILCVHPYRTTGRCEARFSVLKASISDPLRVDAYVDWAAKEDSGELAEFFLRCLRWVRHRLGQLGGWLQQFLGGCHQVPLYAGNALHLVLIQVCNACCYACT